jgi:hypothetical protein
LAVPGLPAPLREKRPRLSVAEAEKVRDGLGGVIGAAWWSLCCTGMIASEYWGVWHARRDHVQIHGTKRAARNRSVPLVAPLERPACTRRELSAALTKLGLESYDARRAYAHWMEETGSIPRARRKLYLGHDVGDVTDLYEMGELSRYLREDGLGLREYIITHSRTLSQRTRGRRRA